MATEPERPIEELLREAAKKRGEQAGGSFELHPATRRMLQTEVSRKFEKRAEDEPAPGFSLLQLLPRLIWGATICAVLALMIWIVVPKSQPDSKQDSLSELAQAPAAPSPSAPATAAPESQFAPVNTAVNRSEPAPAAKNGKWEDLATVDKAKAPATETDTLPSRETARTTEAQPAAQKRQMPQSPIEFKNSDAKDASVTVGEALHPAMADRHAAKDTTRAISSVSVSNNELAMAQPSQEMLAPATAAAVPAPASASPPPPPASAAKPMSFAAESGAVNTRTDVPANSATTTSTSALVNSLDTLSSEKRPQTAAQATQFYRLSFDREKKENTTMGGKTPTAVLTAFRIEQSGSELRIIDSDGSVYKGYVQPATTAARRRSISGFGGTSPAARAPRTAGAVPAGETAAGRGMQDYAFSVSGTSATLRKKVTFQGTLNTVNPLALYNTTSSAETDPAGISGNAGDGAALINARVSGTVSVSGAKDFEIEAATPSP